MQTTTNYGLKKPEENEFISIDDLNYNADKIDEHLTEKLDKTGDASNVTNIFVQAENRVNLSSGEKQSISFGKIMKWFSDLKDIAFSGKASDLTQDSSNRLVTDTEKSSWNGKVNASNGDIQNTKVEAFTASSASWPIPAAGETVKVILGKIVKYFTDLNNWRSTVVLIANIVNNCTSTDTNKPLSANQGKVLMDGKAPKNHATNSTTYGGGTASNYGHVKLSDSYTSSGGAASNSVGASSKAVADAYAKLNSDISHKALSVKKSFSRSQQSFQNNALKGKSFVDVNISCADGSLSRTMRLYTNEYAGFHSEESNSGYKADGTLSFNGESGTVYFIMTRVVGWSGDEFALNKVV